MKVMIFVFILIVCYPLRIKNEPIVTLVPGTIVPRIDDPITIFWVDSGRRQSNGRKRKNHKEKAREKDEKK